MVKRFMLDKPKLSNDQLRDKLEVVEKNIEDLNKKFDLMCEAFEQLSMVQPAQHRWGPSINEGPSS